MKVDELTNALTYARVAIKRAQQQGLVVEEIQLAENYGRLKQAAEELRTDCMILLPPEAKAAKKCPVCGHRLGVKITAVAL